MTRPLDRFLHQVQRLFVLGAPNRPAQPDPTPRHPTQHRFTSTPRNIAAYASAFVLPVGFGAALIPFRDVVPQSISLLMVLPVLLVALLAGARLATAAALSAAATFDVFHTLPYYRFTIDDPDDIVEMVVLLTIGIIIGLLTESAQRSIVSARVRRRELVAITDFVDHIGTPIPGEELAEHARHSIQQVLAARSCEWNPNYHGAANPVLRTDGTLTSDIATPRALGGGILPPVIEIPVGHPPKDHGRFIVRTDPKTDISLEERQAAATIASTLSRCLGR